MSPVLAAGKSETLVSHALKPAEPVQKETRVAPAPVIVEPRVAAPLPPRTGLASHVWLIAAAAALVVGAAVWWMMQSRIPDIDPRELVATNLVAAKQAFDDGRYVDPSESSALHYYSVVLSLDTANVDARHGMAAVANRMMEDVKLAIVDGRLAEAGIALERLRRISPDNRRLALLDAELRREQANQIARLQVPPPALTVQKPASEPAMSTRGKSTKSTRPSAVTESSVAESEPMLHVASSAALTAATMPASPLDMGPPAPSTSDLIAAGESASVDAAIASSSAPVAANPDPVAPADPKLVKMVQPDFPKEARERNVQGWVDVTLAVTAEGDVAGARVNSAENGRFFERAALAAVKQWRYEPRRLADPATMQPVRVRVSFRLQD
jgi:TonB family protein